MISHEVIPEAIGDWIKEHSLENEEDLVAINTAIIVYEGFSSSGEQIWSYEVICETGVMSSVGLLELTKNHMMAPEIEEEEY